MKLLMCLKCQDVKKLQGFRVHCKCRESFGRYLDDDLHAEVKGPCVVIGLWNADLSRLIRNQRESGEGENGMFFVFSKNNERINHLKDDE